MADRHNIIFEAARLHFEQGLKQDDVARRLKVSRPTAARYLAMAREMGYVHVRVLDPKGRVFTDDSIGDILATRELMAYLRDMGEVTGGPAPYDKRDRSRFLQHLDDLIRASLKG